MAFWRRDPVEAAFWEDTATRELLLTIDKYFWPIAVINIIISITSLRRYFHGGAQLASYIMLGAIAITTAITAAAIRRDPIGYYRHRGRLMVWNRVGRTVCYAYMMLYLDADRVVRNVEERVVRGKRPMPFLLILLTQAIGNHQMWGLYFLMPVSQGVWLDLLQQAMRLVVTGMYCVRLIGGPALRPSVTSLCTTLNVVLNTDLLPSVGAPIAPVELFDSRCGEDGPLLLTLFSWWFWGCFWPTFTVWYSERQLKNRFMRRQQGIAGGGPGLLILIRNYLVVNLIVACASWQLLQLLLAQGPIRDPIVTALLSSPWGRLAQSSQGSTSIS